MLGIFGANQLDRTNLEIGVARALENARATQPIQNQPILLEILPAHEATWLMSMAQDPFAISAEEKSSLLLSICAAARDEGANFCSASLSLAREERLFANSLGARIAQTRTRIYPSFKAIAIDPERGQFSSRESLTPARSAGWEYVLQAGLIEEARRAGEEARAKLNAKYLTPGIYDIVIDPTNLWLTIHETIGHSTELDRVLGWEANFAGTSFIKPEMLNNLQIGSELMTIIADRTQPGGLSTIGYDDDGAPAEAADFKIVEKGVFVIFKWHWDKRISSDYPNPMAALTPIVQRLFPFNACQISRLSQTPTNARCKICSKILKTASISLARVVGVSINKETIFNSEVSFFMK